MLQDILAVARPELQLTHKVEQLLWNTSYANLTRRIFTSAHDFFVNLLICLGHNLFDATRVDPSVFHQHLEAQARHLATHWIKATEDDHPWRVIH